MSTLEMLDSIREQFRTSLAELGFAARDPPPASAVPDYKANMHDMNLLHCVLCSGLSPQVVRLVRLKTGVSLIGKGGQTLHLHPSSVNARRLREVGEGHAGAYALYHKKVMTSKVYVHDVTFVSPWSLMLFGSDVSLEREHMTSKTLSVVVDGWLAFKMKEESGVLLKFLKRELDNILLLKVQKPETDIVARSRPVVNTIRRVLASET